MITQERLTELGWVKGDVYWPGTSEKFGKEYFYEKAGKSLRVNEKSGEILTYGGRPTELIKTEVDLTAYETA